MLLGSSQTNIFPATDKEHHTVPRSNYGYLRTSGCYAAGREPGNDATWHAVCYFSQIMFTVLQEGNHTPSTKPIWRVRSGIAVREQEFNRSSGAESDGRPTGDVLHGTERCPVVVDREGVSSLKNKIQYTFYSRPNLLGCAVLYLTVKAIMAAK